MDKDYKKLYEEAFERAKYLKENTDSVGAKDISYNFEYIFPELRESEDERNKKIKKEIIEMLHYYHSKSPCFIPPQFSLEETLAWLEKQKEIETEDFGEFINELSKQFPEVSFAKLSRIAVRIKNWLEKQCEQKPTDEVKPKFNVGDWVQIDGGHVMKILDVKKDVLCYKILNWCGNESVRKISDIDSIAHLWTIEDAKDGDVLATKKGNPFIYDKYRYNNGLAYYYAGLDVNKELTLKSPYTMLTHFGKLCSVSPATKEQRDLLFQKMKEAGYEWDADEKELRKIEQNPAWSEEDEKFLNYASLTDDAQIKNFLKSIKDRVQPQSKQEWSEEDNKIAKELIRYLPYCDDISKDTKERWILWLKSLKPNHWKPSEQNIKDLEWCSDLVKDKMEVGFHRLQVFIDEIKKL